jgi:hypothetical protein
MKKLGLYSKCMQFKIKWQNTGSVGLHIYREWTIPDCPNKLFCKKPRGKRDVGRPRKRWTADVGTGDSTLKWWWWWWNVFTGAINDYFTIFLYQIIRRLLLHQMVKKCHYRNVWVCRFDTESRGWGTVSLLAGYLNRFPLHFIVSFRLRQYFKTGHYLFHLSLLCSHSTIYPNLCCW